MEKLPQSHYRDRWAWTAMILGFSLMATTIYFADFINGNFATEKAQAKSLEFVQTPPPQVTYQQPTSLPQTTAPVYPDSMTDPYLQSVLNDPMNFYGSPYRPTPAQAIVEGRRVEFLMGF